MRYSIIFKISKEFERYVSYIWVGVFGSFEMKEIVPWVSCLPFSPLQLNIELSLLNEERIFDLPLLFRVRKTQLSFCQRLMVIIR